MSPLSLPPSLSCDCYILKDILENWSDEDAAVILKNLRSVTRGGSRMLIIERTLHTGSHSEEKVATSFVFQFVCFFFAFVYVSVFVCLFVCIILQFIVKVVSMLVLKTTRASGSLVQALFVLTN